MAISENYIDFLSNLKIYPDEKGNKTRIKGFRTTDSYFAKAEKLKNSLKKQLEKGIEDPASVLAGIKAFSAGFRIHIYNNRQYRTHESFIFSKDQERFVENVISLYRPLQNFNTELEMLCDKMIKPALESVIKTKASKGIVPGMKINIQDVNFFHIFHQLTELNYEKKPIIEIKNKAKIAECLALFCLNRYGEPISARTIETYLSKPSEKSPKPKIKPFLKVTISDVND